MARYRIAYCYSCGNILIVRAAQKTKLCTYCNTRLTASKMRTLASAQSASEATHIAMAMKEHNRNELP